MRARIARRPVATSVVVLLIAFAVGVLVEPLRVVGALAVLLILALAFAVAVGRVLDRTPRGRFRYLYLIAVGSLGWGILEVVTGSDPGDAVTWTSVVVMVWPLVFVVWWFERDEPRVSARAVMEAVPPARGWLVVAGALVAMAATWPIESDLVRAPVLAAIIAAGGVAIDRAGRDRLQRV